MSQLPKAVPWDQFVQTKQTNPITLIRFGCSIRLPGMGRFICEDDFRRDSNDFIRRWITGAVNTIYSGPLRFSKEVMAETIIVKVKCLP